MFRETRQANVIISQLLHLQLPCYFIDSRTERFSTESRLSLLDIQTQLNFEIPYGQQNSFTAETDLNQRKLASTFKWPHYNFKSSENHRQMNQVHIHASCLNPRVPLVMTRINIATTFLQTLVRFYWRSIQT